MSRLESRQKSTITLATYLTMVGKSRRLATSLSTTLPHDNSRLLTNKQQSRRFSINIFFYIYLCINIYIKGGFGSEPPHFCLLCCLLGRCRCGTRISAGRRAKLPSVYCCLMGMFITNEREKSNNLAKITKTG